MEFQYQKNALNNSLGLLIQNQYKIKQITVQGDSFKWANMETSSIVYLIVKFKWGIHLILLNLRK